jgi:hypothetical protein
LKCPQTPQETQKWVLEQGLRTKQQKNKRVEASSLICNTLGAGGCVRASGWDYDEFTSESSKRDQLVLSRKESDYCKSNENVTTDLVGTTLNISFT